MLPPYLLQEFHGMPNGYYSSTVAAGYARGFEVVMLGRMRALRARDGPSPRGGSLRARRWGVARGGWSKK